jgi:uncharacterized repeat protein (TIGR02543 family)
MKSMKNGLFNRLVAVVLALAMLLVFPVVSFADVFAGSGDVTESSQESNSGSTSQAAESGTSGTDEQKAADTAGQTGNESAGTGSDSTKSDSTASDGSASGASANSGEADADQNADADAEKDAETKYPAANFERTLSDGTKVNVNAPEGAFPAGTIMKVTEVSDSAVEDEVRDVSEDKISEMKAMDISFLYTDKNGNIKEIEPNTEVSVQFSVVGMQGDGLSVYHIADDADTANQVADSASLTHAAVTTADFSIYVITSYWSGTTETTSENSKYKMNVGDYISVHDDSGYSGTWDIASGEEHISLFNKDGESDYFDSPSAMVSGTSAGDAMVSFAYEYTEYNGKNNNKSRVVKKTDYFYITVNSGKLTVTYHSNGGSAAAPAAVEASSGDEVVMPKYVGIKLGYNFIGWSTDSDANGQGSGHYTKAVYLPGGTYTVEDSNVNLYAVWAATGATDAEFYIRLDGQIPTEPQGHDSAGYTGAIAIPGAIKAGCGYFYTNSTAGVGSQLAKQPSETDIAAACSNWNETHKDKTQIQYDDTKYVLWYVVKHESTWHIDGVLLDKAKVNLSYNPNAPAGTWSNMPDGSQYAVGATAEVSNKVPVRSGYIFTGWNTSRDGTGTAYAASTDTDSVTFTINEATTLYAQWIPKSNTPYTVKHWIPDSSAEGGYSVVESKTQTKYGKTDTEVTETPAAVSIDGYVYDDETTMAQKGDTKWIITDDGSLVINLYYKAQKSITIKAKDGSKTYDGTALTDQGYEITSGSLNEGDSLSSVKVDGTITDAGTQTATASGAVIKNGTKDVTANYNITYEPGTLTVDPVPVTITAKNDHKMYDGTALTNSGYDVTGNFVGSDGLADVTVSGSRTFVGTSANTVDSYTFKEGTKASNYAVTKVNGTLTIDQASIAIAVTADNAEKAYDGTALTKGTYTTAGDLASGDKITGVTVSGQQIDAGTGLNVPAGAVIMHGDTDVSENYVVTYNKGSLKVTPAAVELTAGSKTRAYDGTALIYNSYSITKGQFYGNDGLASVTVSGSQTTVGTSANTISAHSLKEGTKAGNYNITYKPGTLEITQASIPVTITAGSLEAPYSGAAISTNNYSITSGKLAGNDRISSVTVSGSRKDAGSSDNIASDAVIMNGTENVTANYQITYLPGTLKVTPISVELTANSASKEYDGIALTDGGYSVTGGAFIGNDGLAAVTVEGSRTHVGTADNIIKGYLLKAGTNADNYTITRKPGKLEVTNNNPRAITVTAEGASRTYDGTALTQSGYDLTEGTLAKGDHITAVTSGSQTNAGESSNIITEVKVIHSDGTDVSANYRISTKAGTLKVNREKIELTAGSKTRAYNGTALTDSSYTQTGGTFYGNDGIETATVEGSQTLTGTSANTITSHTFKTGTISGNYEVSYKPGTLEVTKGSIALKVTAASDSKTYDGSALANDRYSAEGLAGSDAISSVKVAGSITDAGTAANKAEDAVVMHTNADGSKTDVTENYSISYKDGSLNVSPVAIQLTADSASKPYDGTALTADGYTVSNGKFVGTDGLAKVKVEGSQTLVGTTANEIKGHTLKDGTKARNYTITYQPGTLEVTKASIALTITADSAERAYNGEDLTKSTYTKEGTLANGDEITGVTVRGAQKNAGSSDNTASAAVISHTNADGTKTDVTQNYAITYKNGTLKVNPAAVELTAGSAEKVYNGLPLTDGSYEITKGAFVGTDGIKSAVVSGSQTLVGDSANTITSHVLKEGTKAGNYAITYKPGTLKVTQASIKLDITAADAERTYDGTPLQNHEYTYSGTLAAGDTISGVTVTGSRTDAGETPNVANAVVIMHDGTDVTQNYDVTFHNGTLKVNKAEVNVTTPDADKTYDGTYLTAAGKMTGLVNGETATFTTTGKQEAVGSSDNTYSLTWNGTANKDNYKVNESIGTLTVKENNAAITVTTTGGKFTYDGAAHGATVAVSELPAGYTLDQATSKASAKDVTKSPVAATCDKLVISNAEGEDVTSKLNINYVDGTIQVIPAVLTVNTPNASKTYDGEYLTAAGTIEGFVHGESAPFATTGKQKAVGTSDNTYSIDWTKGNATESNYTVKDTVGKLTVTESAAEITVTTTGGNYTYDGTAHGATVTVSGLPKGYTLGTHTSSAQATDVTAAPVAATCDKLVIRNAEGEDVTSKLNITYKDGTITVAPATLIVKTDSASRAYNGKPLTAPGEIKGFVKGETASFAVTGTRTKVGNVTNGYSLTWDGSAKKSNYTVNESLGTLTVTESANEIVVTTTGGEYTYDGHEHGATVKVSDLPEGYTLKEASSSAKATDVTAEDVKATCDDLVILNADREDVTSKLKITKADGTIKITPAKLTVATPDAARTYNGTALTAAGTISGFVNGETAAFTTTGSRRDVGESKNTYEIDWTNATAKESNYTIDETVGTLTVSKMDLTITADSASKIDDGNVLTMPSYTNTPLADGDSLASVTIIGSQKGVGKSANVASDAKIVRSSGRATNMMRVMAAADEDVTGNYNITYADGTLELLAQTIIPTPDAGKYILTINYVDQDGKALKTAYAEQYSKGDVYSVDSPVFTGYKMADSTQSIVTGTMPGENVTVTVVYKKTAVSPNNPNNPGNNTTPAVVSPGSDKSAQTGDTSSMIMWICLALLGGIGALTAATGRKRKEEEK